jgi:hypothetical protein
MRCVLLLSFLLSSACAATPVEPSSAAGVQETVEGLSVELVDLASRRVDMSTIRATILPFRGDGTASTAVTNPVAGSAPIDHVDAELRREFELALANRVHLVEPISSGPESSATQPESAPSAASHALVGNYTVRDDKLVLSVRLVELESSLVLSAARGELPLSWFSPKALAQLRPPALLPPAGSTWAHPVPAATTVQGEDFQTWRARHLNEQAAQSPAPPAKSPTEKHLSSATAPAAAEPSSSSSTASLSARPPATDPRQLLSRFPWRESNLLAELLGVPPEKRWK